MGSAWLGRISYEAEFLDPIAYGGVALLLIGDFDDEIVTDRTSFPKTRLSEGGASDLAASDSDVNVPVWRPLPGKTSARISWDSARRGSIVMSGKA